MLEVLRDARIVNVDKLDGTLTVTGTDTITGNVITKAFEFVSKDTLQNAENYAREQITLVIGVNPSTKNIEIRAQDKLQERRDPMI